MKLGHNQFDLMNGTQKLININQTSLQSNKITGLFLTLRFCLLKIWWYKLLSFSAAKYLPLQNPVQNEGLVYELILFLTL